MFSALYDVFGHHRSKAKQSRNEQVGLIKLRSFHTEEETFNKIKTTHRMVSQKIVSHTPNKRKGLRSRMYKELIKLKTAVNYALKTA